MTGKEHQWKFVVDLQRDTPFVVVDAKTGEDVALVSTGDHGELIALLPEILMALENLAKKCGCVEPLRNTVSCDTVPKMRRAMDFMEAVEGACAVLAQTKDMRL